MRVRVLRLARVSIQEGVDFYESQDPGLGIRFFESIMTDIRSLNVSGGAHQIVEKGYHRKICTTFPFSIYYKLEHSEVYVYRVLDNRSDPHWISDRLN